MRNKWTFERDTRSSAGFLSRNRASTDALSALSRWEAQRLGRSHDIERDGDDEIVVSLSCDASDASAGADLDALCLSVGVCRRQTDD